ncbi:hypothetical protein J2T15_005160 [Paenibacillus harenae]|uniref:Peptidase M10 metallopeptidase domain-containing protein n=2 Tax=Paenibacillus harenae TaxID=306543 RepID=A0ABT9U7R3_PAEHA|nr:hypothetical protein [Paenibacillus harenae]
MTKKPSRPTRNIVKPKQRTKAPACGCGILPKKYGKAKASVRCLVLSIYVAPGSTLNQTTLNNHLRSLSDIWQACGISFAYRFVNADGSGTFMRIEGPVVNPNAFVCGGTYRYLDPYFQEWLAYRPGSLRTDIAIYYVRGPLVGDAIGCAPFITPNGRAVIVTNAYTDNVLAHEIGHVLGLGHVPVTPANRSNLMYPFSFPESRNLTSAQCVIALQSPALQDCTAAASKIIPKRKKAVPVYKKPSSTLQPPKGKPFAKPRRYPRV